MTNTIKPIKRILNPKKLLNSKWTAVTPTNKEKHFIVTKLISPDLASASIETILLEAVHSKHSQQLPWQVAFYQYQASPPSAHHVGFFRPGAEISRGRAESRPIL